MAFDDFARLQKRYKKGFKKLLRESANETANFFQDNITKQVNVRGVPMRKRVYTPEGRKGRKVLIKSGNLRRSIRVESISGNTATISSNLPYSALQNDGGQQKITPRQRKFFWAKHYEAVRRDGGGRRRRNEDADFWRNMALKKSPIKFNKRRFMGNSRRLERKINAFIQNELDFRR